MKFYGLEPEVAGSLGKNTQIDTAVHPPRVYKLHYELDGWLGDDLLESFPCYLITESLKQKIETLKPSGCRFDNVEITQSDQFAMLYPQKDIPNFFWLRIHGKAGVDDLGVSDDNMLIVSERILSVMKNFHLNNCDIEEYRTLYKAAA